VCLNPRRLPIRFYVMVYVDIGGAAMLERFCSLFFFSLTHFLIHTHTHTHTQVRILLMETEQQINNLEKKRKKTTKLRSKGERTRRLCFSSANTEMLIKFAMSHASHRGVCKVSSAFKLPLIRGSDGIVARSMIGRTLPFGHAMQLLESVRSHYILRPNILNIEIEATRLTKKGEKASTNRAQKVTVVGSLNGQLQDLLTVFTLSGALPTQSNSNHFVFSGNIVGSSPMSCETFLLLCALKKVAPNRVDILRGSNESRLMSLEHNFTAELRVKYGEENGDIMFRKFQECFDTLPLGMFVELKTQNPESNLKLSPRIFVVHGGLFRRYGVQHDDIDGIMRHREPPVKHPSIRARHIGGVVTDEDELFESLLWSTPMSKGMGACPSEQGRGVRFGMDKSAEFCWRNRVLMMIQSHGTQHEKGYFKTHYPQQVTDWNHRRVASEDKQFRPLVLRLNSASSPLRTHTRRGAFAMISASYKSHLEGDAYRAITFDFKTKTYHARGLSAFRLHSITQEML